MLFLYFISRAYFWYTPKVHFVTIIISIDFFPNWEVKYKKRRSQSFAYNPVYSLHVFFLCYLTLDFRIILTISIGFFYIVTKLFHSTCYFSIIWLWVVNCVKCNITYFVNCQICGWSDSSQQEVWVWKNAVENFSRKHFSQTSRHWQPDWGSTICE